MSAKTNRRSWLVAYYSRSGNTKAAAEEMAERLGADLLEIQSDRNYSSTPLGYFRAALDTAIGRSWGYQFDRSDLNLRDYSGLVIASPVWMSSIAPPVLEFLKSHSGEFPRTACLLTYGGSGSERAFKKGEEALGTSFLTKIAITEKEVLRGFNDPALKSRMDFFTQKLPQIAKKAAATAA